MEMMKNSASLPKPLRGIIPPVVTPLAEIDQLDHASLERLIEHLIEGGVHGLFLLGTTGGAPALSYRLRRELVERACAQVAGRVPVLVGVSDSSYTECHAMATHAAEAGADAVVVAPPFYFSMSQTDLYRWVSQLAQQTALPLYLYNMPGLTKAWFEPETVARLAELPSILGLKDSSADLDYLARVKAAMANRPDFALLVGPEELLSQTLRMGTHGGVCGGANLFPKLFTALYAAAVAGDWQRADELQQIILELGRLLYGIGEPQSSYLRGLLLGMELLGLAKSLPPFPYAPIDSRKYADLAQRLKDLCGM